MAWQSATLIADLERSVNINHVRMDTIHACIHMSVYVSTHVMFVRKFVYFSVYICISLYIYTFIKSTQIYLYMELYTYMYIHAYFAGSRHWRVIVFGGKDSCEALGNAMELKIDILTQ